ncbi:hypothetical protein, partial [Stenotrophomonas maltophilia]
NGLTRPEAVANYRQQLRKEFTDGRTKLDADGYERADALLEQREQKLRAKGVSDRAQVSGLMDKIVRQSADGIPSS